MEGSSANKAKVVCKCGDDSEFCDLVKCETCDNREHIICRDFLDLKEDEEYVHICYECNSSKTIYTPAAYLCSVLNIQNDSLKCERLEHYLEDILIKDFHQFLPHLLANIFGYDQTKGWGLKALTSGHADFFRLRTFLCPKGKLFQLMSKLDQKNFLFKFPIAMLPQPVQVALQKTNFVHENYIPVSAFEYYFYHFACFLSIQQSSIIYSGNMPENLYTILLNEYLNFYMPFCGTVPEAPKTQEQSSRRISGTFSSGAEIEDVSSTISISESFVEIFLSSWITHQQKEDDVFQVSRLLFMPSDETILLLRRFVKHIFYFSNGVSSPSQGSYEAFQTSKELRKTIIASRVRKRLYTFLESCLKYCACDSGYRFIVELWLTYIQPWRYTDPHIPADSKDKMENSSKWSYFIAENFPFYSSLFVIFLGRSQSFDLSASLPSLLLYRVTKVFCRGNLWHTVSEVEFLLLNNGSVKKYHSSSDDFWALSPNFIRASVIECCGPEYCYTPIFHEKTIQEVNKILFKLVMLKEKIQSAYKAAAHQACQPNKESTSIFSKVTTYFSASDQKTKNGYGDLPLIDSVIKQLQQIFDLADGLLDEQPNQYDNSFSLMKGSADEACLPDQSKEFQLVERLSGASNRLSVGYKGDTFTQPFRSYENPTLVRLLCKLSVNIGENYIDCVDRQSFTYKLVSRTLTKSSGSSSPARINLRPLASYYNIVLLFIILILTKTFFSSNFVSLIVVLLTILCFILFQK